MSRSIRAPGLGLIGRQIIQEIALHTSIAAAASIALYMSVDSVEVVNRALSRTTLTDMVRLQIYNIPAIIQQFAMILVLIGGITGITTLVRRQEIVALFATGGGPACILKPVLIVGTAIALLYAAMTEWIAPVARAEVSAARLRLGLPASSGDAFGTSRTWFRGADLIYRIQVLASASGRTLKEVLMLRIRDGQLLDRWDVHELHFEQGHWVGEGIVHRQFIDQSVSAVGQRLITEHIPRALMPIEEQPEDFVTSIGSPDRLPYAKLVAALRARERLGQPTLSHSLELYRRITYPLTLIAAVALSAATALRLGQRPSVAMALGIGVLLGFVLWLTDEVSLALGTTAALSPAAAHRFPLIFIGAAAVSAWIYAHKQGLRSR